MKGIELPRVALKTEVEPPPGLNTYQAIPELVEFHRLGPLPSKTRSIALGRVLLSLDAEGGEFVGLQSHVKTGRWKTDQEPLPVADAEGSLVILHPEGEEGLSFLAADPHFTWHDESSSLHISLGGETALVFKIASCLLAGVDRKGRLSDIWMLDLDLSLE